MVASGQPARHWAAFAEAVSQDVAVSQDTAVSGIGGRWGTRLRWAGAGCLGPRRGVCHAWRKAAARSGRVRPRLEFLPWSRVCIPGDPLVETA